MRFLGAETAGGSNRREGWGHFVRGRNHWEPKAFSTVKRWPKKHHNPHNLENFHGRLSVLGGDVTVQAAVVKRNIQLPTSGSWKFEDKIQLLEDGRWELKSNFQLPEGVCWKLEFNFREFEAEIHLPTSGG